MRYTILGDDGRTYGPVTADEVRRWIRQRRVDSRTMVYAEGAPEWTYAGVVPDFAGEFAGASARPGHPPAITPPGPGPTVSGGTNWLAMWGFVFGLLSWSCCGCCLPLGIVGLVFSIIGLAQINGSGGAVNGRGFAIAGIILSATNLMWSVWWTILSFLNDSSQVQFHLGNIVNSN